MGVASLVLGIICIILAIPGMFFPCCEVIIIIPAIVGIVLGAVDMSKKKKAGEPTGKAVAGLILSTIAVILPIILIIAVGGLTAISAAMM